MVAESKRRPDEVTVEGRILLAKLDGFPLFAKTKAQALPKIKTIKTGIVAGAGL